MAQELLQEEQRQQERQVATPKVHTTKISVVRRINWERHAWFDPTAPVEGVVEVDSAKGLRRPAEQAASVPPSTKSGQSVDVAAAIEAKEPDVREEEEIVEPEREEPPATGRGDEVQAVKADRPATKKRKRKYKGKWHPNRQLSVDDYVSTIPTPPPSSPLPGATEWPPKNRRRTDCAAPVGEVPSYSVRRHV